MPSQGGTTSLAQPTLISWNFAKIFWGVLYIGKARDFFGVGGGRALGGGYIKKNKTGTNPGGTKREHFYLVNNAGHMDRDNMSQPCALFVPQL